MKRSDVRQLLAWRPADVRAANTMTSLMHILPVHEQLALSVWIQGFWPFQQKWLLDWSNYSMLLKSRQIGASYTYGALATLWGMLGEKTSLVSKNKDAADFVLDYAETHCQKLQSLGSTLARCVRTRSEINFHERGGKLRSVPSQGARGTSGNVILDEFAYYDHEEEVWDATAPAATQGHRIRILSTPNGVGNMFHRFWFSGNKAFRGLRHATTIDEAIAQGMPVNIEHCWQVAMYDPRRFDQIYRCQFLDADTQFITSAMLKEASFDFTHHALPQGEVERYGGMDIGKEHDLTAFATVSIDRYGVLWAWPVETRKRTSEDDLDGLLYDGLVNHGLVRVALDATGIGSFPADRFQQRYGEDKIEKVVFTLQMKEKLATTLYRVMAENRLKIPTSDSQLRDDLASLRRIPTAAGNLRYDAPRTEGGHADRAWALALAVYSAVSGDDRRKYVFESEEDDNELE